MNEYKHDEAYAWQGFRRTLVAACQTPETVEPAEAAFDHPAMRQQHEALLRLLLRDELQLNALLQWGLRRDVVRVAPVG
jgi:hypothetical protein